MYKQKKYKQVNFQSGTKYSAKIPPFLISNLPITLLRSKQTEHIPYLDSVKKGIKSFGFASVEKVATSSQD